MLNDMKLKYMLLVLSSALLAFPGSHTWARGWYLGGGIESVSFGDDLEGIDDGSGPVFSFGYRFSTFFALDALWGASIHDEGDTGREVTQGNLLGGGGVDFFVADKHAISVGFRSSNWNGEDDLFDYDVTTQILSLVYNYHFSR